MNITEETLNKLIEACSDLKIASQDKEINDDGSWDVEEFIEWIADLIFNLVPVDIKAINRKFFSLRANQYNHSSLRDIQVILNQIFTDKASSEPEEVLPQYKVIMRTTAMTSLLRETYKDCTIFDVVGTTYNIIIEPKIKDKMLIEYLNLYLESEEFEGIAIDKCLTKMGVEERIKSYCKK